jgi:hypothetical protein
VLAGFLFALYTMLAGAAVFLAGLVQDAQRIAASAPPSAESVGRLFAAANNPKLSSTTRWEMAMKARTAQPGARLSGVRP